MRITQEEAIPITGHHRDICRFSGPDDQRFEAMWKAIRRLVYPKPEENGSPGENTPGEENARICPLDVSIPSC